MSDLILSASTTGPKPLTDAHSI